MDEIIKKLEEAKDADRTLDPEVWMALHPEWKEYPRDDRQEPGWMTPHGRSWCPGYTSSVDAAIGLVPREWAWLVEWIGAPFSEGTARCWIPAQRTQGLKHETVQANGATPAIALCIAALKVRKAITEG